MYNRDTLIMWVGDIYLYGPSHMPHKIYGSRSLNT